MAEGEEVPRGSGRRARGDQPRGRCEHELVTRKERLAVPHRQNRERYPPERVVGRDIDARRALEPRLDRLEQLAAERRGEAAVIEPARGNGIEQGVDVPHQIGTPYIDPPYAKGAPAKDEDGRAARGHDELHQGCTGRKGREG